MRALKETVVKKSKWKLERSCEDDGWLTFLPRSQYGTDISREYFRGALWWHLDLSFQDAPLACDGCSDLFIVEHTRCCKRGSFYVSIIIS